MFFLSQRERERKNEGFNFPSIKTSEKRSIILFERNFNKMITLLIFIILNVTLIILYVWMPYVILCFPSNLINSERTIFTEKIRTRIVYKDTKEETRFPIRFFMAVLDRDSSVHVKRVPKSSEAMRDECQMQRHGWDWSGRYQLRQDYLVIMTKKISFILWWILDSNVE